MISEAKIAEVRGAARISDFISPYITLKRSGRGLMGLCPFHGEKSPSFSVNDESGFYHCFGCGAGGNVFKFVMQMENLSFPEAVRKVASHYGIDVPDEGVSPGQASEREASFAMLAAAARFYRAALSRTPFGEEVGAYLEGRGIGDEARERFYLGAAPASGDALAAWLRREKHDLKLAERIGLVGLRGSSPWDRFRGRLVFPIRDPQGRVLGFGARRMGEGDGPKYLNSSDSPVYHKGRVLYGLFEAREAEKAAAPKPGAPATAPTASAGEKQLVLVEGYLDVIAMSQAGLTNVVAGCGTALTVEQARLMRRHAGDVVALFDGDDAGRRAAARSFPLFVEAGLWARGVFLPDGEDPDTFVRTRGATRLRGEIDSGRPLVEAYARHVAQGSTGAGAAARTGAELAEVLRKVENPFEYDDFVKKAALWTGISEQVLRQQSRPAARPAPRTPMPAVALPKGPPGAEEIIISVLLSDASAVAGLEMERIVPTITREPWTAILTEIVASMQSEAGYQPGEVLSGLDDALRNRLVARLHDDPSFADADVRRRLLEDAVARLDAVALEASRKRMLAELRRLEELGDEQGAAALLEKWKQYRGTRGL